ncbi:MAG: radical SAM protein [Lachnospiraceae bacterium]|jgi:DNA repair photolyase|nr:radical SAM protein [Lachnospiraceae bacterium]
MEYITRKSMLYKTKVEYGDYTINHVQGCSHGCKYPCYAMMLSKRFGRCSSYEDWCKPKLVKNTLQILDKELPKLKDKIQSIQLCFMTDPFMYNYPEISQMSIDIIDKCNENGIVCTALTKGLLPKELKHTLPSNEYGITLISLDEKYRKENEPGSAPYLERIASLKYLHENGFKTWVSIEPYPTPNIIQQNFNDILESIKFVDKIIFGRLNYNKLVTQYKNYQQFYNDLTKQVMEFCQKNNIACHIKNGTYKP